MGSNCGSNSDLQECGLQQWWFPSPTPEYMYSQELPGSQVVKFSANLTDRQYRNVQEDCRRYFGIHVSRDQAPTVFHVTGYDAVLLEGQQVLGVFQRYDWQAGRITSTQR